MSAFEQANRLRPYLLPGERLLWTGRPVQGLALRRSDLWVVPLTAGFVFLGLRHDAQVAEVMLRSFDLTFAVRAAIFLGGGVYVGVARFFHDAWLRRRTLYAVSDRRLLFLRTGPFGWFRSIEIGYLPLLEYEEASGGRGTLTFDFEEQPKSWWALHLAGWFGIPSLSGSRCFDRIAGPRRVYDLIVRESDRRREARTGEIRSKRELIG
jgi:hypothetical protein